MSGVSFGCLFRKTAFIGVKSMRCKMSTLLNCLTFAVVYNDLIEKYLRKRCII